MFLFQKAYTGRIYMKHNFFPIKINARNQTLLIYILIISSLKIFFFQPTQHCKIHYNRILSIKLFAILMSRSIFFTFHFLTIILVVRYFNVHMNNEYLFFIGIFCKYLKIKLRIKKNIIKIFLSILVVEKS
jgi:hypothetical protein